MPKPLLELVPALAQVGGNNDGASNPLMTSTANSPEAQPLATANAPNEPPPPPMGQTFSPKNITEQLWKVGMALMNAMNTRGDNNTTTLNQSKPATPTTSAPSSKPVTTTAVATASGKT